MAYALESMLRIRVMREDRAGKDLVSARHAREVAQVELDSRKRKLDAYAQTKEERRDRVFDTILGRPVPRDEIDRVRTAISQIDEEGVLLTDGVTRAKADLETREQEAEKAHGRFVGCRSTVKSGRRRNAGCRRCAPMPRWKSLQEGR